MKRTFYISTTDTNGLENGKIYYVGDDGKIVLSNGERVPANIMIWKKLIKEIPHYEGTLKEEWEWPSKKAKFQMAVSDGMATEDMEVTIAEVHKTKGRLLVCLAQLPTEEGFVQMDIPHLYVE